MTLEPQIRYAKTSDGVNIAYTRLGNGPPVLFCAHQLAFAATLAAGFLLHDTLLSCASVTHFDQAGCGASDRDVADLSINAYVRAAEAVVAASMPDERFTVIAHYAACAGAARYVAEHADRVERLICLSPVPAVPGPEAVATDWSLGRRMIAGMYYPEGPIDRQRWYSRALRDSISHAAWMAWNAAYLEIDQLGVFEQVRVPTLIVVPRHYDSFRQHATRLAAAVADARLVLFDMKGPATDDGSVTRACREFMGIESAAGNENTRGDTAVILFADIVESTALTERLGDAGFRSAARAIDGRMRTAIRVAGGTAIDGKLLGDGVLAVFTSAANAIDAALACVRACEGSGLELHLGLHAGDVIREEGNVFGGAVNIASRISALSEPGEVLVSDIVRGLARTSAGVMFEDRGEHALKGVGDAQRVYAVRKDGG